MRNVLVIARKEVKAYFSSPIGYAVIAAFVFIFGYFYIAILSFFVRQSMQVSQFAMGGQQTVNVNEQMLRPLLLNTSTIMLFILPMLTMRTYAEEKRSGTIELLLTSPITDVQIILGKFLGALTLYAVMLAVTLIHIGILFVYGTPAWQPIATAYLGLLLMGASFISLGLFLSSLTKNQIVALVVTFSVFLMFWVIDWIGSFSGPTIAALTNYLSITQHLDDFSKGVIDLSHVVFYLSFIAFGLFLTLRSVDSERWRG